MNDIDLKMLSKYITDSDELIAYFYKMSYSMEKLHDNGYYISDFRPNKILFDTKKGEFIFKVEKIRPDFKNDIIRSNIITFAALLTNVYVNRANLFNSDVLFQKDYLQDTIEDFKYAYDSKDYPYFYDLFKKDDIIYYHEYIDKMNQEYGLQSVNKTMVKATSVGTLLSENNDEIVFNKAAFVSIPAVFVMATVLMFLMICIFVIVNY